MSKDTKTDQDKYSDRATFLEFVRTTGKEYEAIQEVNLETGEKGSTKISFYIRNNCEVIARFFESGNLADIAVDRGENDSR